MTRIPMLNDPLNDDAKPYRLYYHYWLSGEKISENTLVWGTDWNDAKEHSDFWLEVFGGVFERLVEEHQED